MNYQDNVFLKYISDYRIKGRIMGGVIKYNRVSKRIFLRHLPQNDLVLKMQNPGSLRSILVFTVIPLSILVYQVWYNKMPQNDSIK